MERETKKIGHIDSSDGGLYVRQNTLGLFFVLDDSGALYCSGQAVSRLVIKDDGGLYLNPKESNHEQ